MKKNTKYCLPFFRITKEKLTENTFSFEPLVIGQSPGGDVRRLVLFNCPTLWSRKRKGFNIHEACTLIVHPHWGESVANAVH